MATTAIPQPKFKVGDKVIHLDNESSKILAFSFDGKEYRYKISSVEWDSRERRVIQGVKNCSESELRAVPNKEK